MGSFSHGLKSLSIFEKVAFSVAAVVCATGTAYGVANTSTPSPTETPAAQTVQAAPKEPVVSTTTETRYEAVPFEKTTINDGNLDEGKTALRTAGVNGTRTITETVTLTDGVETARTIASSVVTTAPTTEVTAVGTRVARASNCNPNYTPCVPNASDVDCASGSGNGPAYVSGPVSVTGYDVYGLDRDGDGVGCDS